MQPQAVVEAGPVAARSEQHMKRGKEVGFGFLLLAAGFGGIGSQLLSPAPQRVPRTANLGKGEA